MYCVGVDVGGTKVLAVLVEQRAPAVVLASAERPTGYGSHVLDVIDTVLDAVLAGSAPGDGPRRPAAIGIGLPGLVERSGVLRYGPNLPGAVDLSVADVLAARYGCPVAVDNDGNCAAWAEHLLGAGQGCDDMVFVGLGTGISSGLVLDGRRHRGAHGFAAEPGHMVVVADGPRCACGRLGCWEAVASGTALAAQAVAAGRAGTVDHLVASVGGDPGALRGEQITFGLLRGDPGAVAVAEVFGRWVGLGVANLVHLLDPAVVVLGGSVLSEPEPWMGYIEAGYRRAVMGGPLRAQTRIRPAVLGRAAGAVGAAVLAMELLPSAPQPGV